MSVSKRGKFFHYRFKLDGTLYRGSTNETALGKARQVESILMSGIRDGSVNPQVRKSPTLAVLSEKFLEFVDKATEGKHLDEDTRKCYRNGWRLLSEAKIGKAKFADMRIDRIYTSDAASLTFPGSASNGNQALRTLRRMLSYACEVKLLRAAPKIKLLEELGRAALIEPWVEDLLLELAPEYFADIIVIMLDCGMRPEEARRMRWEHVHWDRSVILIPHGKSLKARRFVGLTDRMRQRLKWAAERNAAAAKKAGREDSPWVFPSDSASGHRTNTTKVWGQTLAKVNRAVRDRKLALLPDDLVLYSARHTFATNFLANGGDLAQLMALLGHSSITTTQKYLHPSTADSAERMNKHNRNKAGLRIVKSA
jgi:integrase